MFLFLYLKKWQYTSVLKKTVSVSLNKYFFVFLLCIAGGVGLSQTNSAADRFFLAQSLEQAGEYERAMEMYEILYTQEPNNAVYLNSLNNTYIQLKQYTKSLNILKPRYAVKPNDAQLAGLLGKTYYFMGNDKETFRIWDDFLERNPNNAQYFRNFSFLSADIRSFDHAIDYLQRGKKVSTDKKSFAYDLSNLYMITMAYSSAAVEFVDILKSDPLQLPMVEARIAPYSMKQDAIVQMTEVFEKNQNENDAIKSVLAKLYAEANNFDKAFTIYKELDLSQNKQGNELFYFGQQILAKGKYEIASDVFAYILSSYPKSSLAGMVKLSYAKTLEYVLDDQTEHASSKWKPLIFKKKLQVASYQKIIDSYLAITALYQNSDPAIESYYRIGMLYARGGLLDSASAYFSQIVAWYSLSPFAADACEELADIYVQRNNLDSGIIVLKKIIENPRASLAQKNRAQMKAAYIHFYRNELEDARQSLAEIMKTTRDDETNDAIELSMLLNTGMNDSLGLTYYASILNKIDREDVTGIDDLFLKIAKLQNQFFLKSISELKQVEIKIANDELGSAIALINELLKQKSNIFLDKASFYLGQIYQYGLKDNANALKVYETFLENYSSSLYVDKIRDEIQVLRSQIQ